MKLIEALNVLPRDGHDDAEADVASDPLSIRLLASPVRRAIAPHAAVAARPAARRRLLVRRTGRRHDPRERDDPAAGLPGPRGLATWPGGCAAYLVEKQLPDGGWAMYPGGGVEISGSVKAYFALKLTGHDPSAEYMQRARAGDPGPRRGRRRQQLHALLPGPARARFPTSNARPCRRRSCCCPSGSRSISTRSAPGRGRSSCRCRSSRRCGRCGGSSRGWASASCSCSEPERLAAAAVPGPAGRHGPVELGPLLPHGRPAVQVVPASHGCCRCGAGRWPRPSGGCSTASSSSDGLGAIYPPIVWSIVALKCLGYRRRQPRGAVLPPAA